MENIFNIKSESLKQKLFYILFIRNKVMSVYLSNYV